MPVKQEPFWSYKKARAVSRQQSNKMGKLDNVPMCFEVKEGVDGCRMIKVLCTEANGNVCRKELIFY